MQIGVSELQFITLTLSIVGIAFGIYHFFRNPQITQEKMVCLLDEKFKNHTQLSDQLKTIEQNHLHTIEESIKSHSAQIQSLENRVTQLATIIDERIPKKSQ
jgi:galactokinase